MKAKQIMVEKTYKLFLDSSKYYELSGLRFICLEHGFQKETNLVSKGRDMFGMVNNFIHICQICGKECKQEKAKEFIMKKYKSWEWVEE